MDRRARMFVSTLLILLPLLPATPRAEVLHGTATLNYSSWQCGLSQTGTAMDFNTLTTVDFWAAEADLSLSQAVNTCNLTFWLPSGGGGTPLFDVSLEELGAAPEGYYASHHLYPVQVNVVYVLRTTEGLYVKFAVRAIREPSGVSDKQADIEYYVQTDGTREFGPILPVAKTTWGQVKALYR